MQKNFPIRSLLYVNFAPYENAGNILTFLIPRCEILCVITFNFHRISEKQDTSHILVYKKGNLKARYTLPQMNIPEQFIFIFLPLRITFIFFSLLVSCLFLTRSFGPFDLFLSVNAFTAWVGNILRFVGHVQKTIFWVWDYYPPTHPNPIILASRRLYWFFDRRASLDSDKIVFLNTKLEEVRKDLGILPSESFHAIIPIGTDPISSLRKIKLPSVIAFFAVLKKSQGLDLFFDTFERFPSHKKLSLHIIGGGPDKEYFEERAKNCSVQIIFHGYVQREEEVDAILSRCHIGIAPYKPDSSNVSPFTDPSKIKRYLSHAIPVITTNATGFASEIEKARAGIIIPYSEKAFHKALLVIMKHYSSYQHYALALARKFQYERIYPELFTS